MTADRDGHNQRAEVNTSAAESSRGSAPDGAEPPAPPGSLWRWLADGIAALAAFLVRIGRSVIDLAAGLLPADRAELREWLRSLRRWLSDAYTVLAAFLDLIRKILSDLLPAGTAEPMATPRSLGRRLADGFTAFAAFLALTRKTLFDLTAVLLPVGVVAFFVAIMLDDTVVLETPTVPQAVQDRGITPGLLTQLLQARMEAVREAADSKKPSEMPSPADDPLIIEAAGFNLSLTSLAYKAKRLLGLNNRRSLSVSVLCGRPDCAQGPLSLQVVALGHRTAAANTVPFDIERPEPAIDASVQDLLRAFDPNLLGTYYFRIDNRDGARDVAQQVLSQGGDTVWARNLLGIIALRDGDLEDAAYHLDRALKMRPDFVAALVNRGNLYVSQNIYDAAIESYKKAIDIDPENATAWNNLGSVYLRACQWEPAVRSFEEARRINPRYAAPLRGLARVEETRIPADRAEASRLRRLAHELDPDFKPEPEPDSSPTKNVGVNLGQLIDCVALATKSEPAQ